MAHRYLLDTHALIWFLEGNKKLSQNVKTIMASPDTDMEAMSSELVAQIEASPNHFRFNLL